MVKQLTAFLFAVIKIALPGIKEYLEEVLLEEKLSEKGEKIRLYFVDILNNLGSKSLSGEIFTSLTNDQELETSHHSLETRTERSKDDLLGYVEDNTVQAHWPEKTTEIEEKVFIYLHFFEAFSQTEKV